MGWNLEEVEKFYDTYAHQYDNDTPDVEYPSSRLLSQWVRNYLTRFSHPIKILDVGCGTGKRFDYSLK
jgi:predicted TPR repeat methyltransferase